MKMRHLVTMLALAASGLAAAAGPDTEVVEFYNVGLGHYFITASASDVRLIEDGAEGPGWVKTGRTFQAWSDASLAPPGAVPVCRFYSPGANSHFFTAKSSECDVLKAMEAAERATSANPKGWLFEGTGFAIEAPQAGQCPAGTQAIQRFYNNGFESGVGANHRYVDDAGAVELMAQSGWNPEGAAFCARMKSTGTQANLPVTTTSFDTLAATWHGNTKFEVELGGKETQAVAPMQVTIDASGAITGTGGGCTFTGQVASGDGFRSLFMGTVTATGCTDPAFNGDFARVKLERFGAAVLKLRLQREDATTEASIEATLTTDTPSTPPNTPPTTASFDRIDGDWVGTLRWEAQAASGEVQANHALALSISSGGALSGTGFGCTVTGQLSAGIGETFTGTATFAGCDTAAFNGNYDGVRISSEGATRIEASFKRHAGGSEAEIEGTLDAQGATTPNPNPNPAPASNTVVGSWSGATSFTGGSVRATDTLMLTVGADGTVSGSGRGCTFTGTLALDASKQEAKGTIVASGCTDAAFNGSFANADLKVEDGSALEVEMQREANGVELKIQGTLARQ